MAEYFQVLPSITLGKPEPRSNVESRREEHSLHTKKCSSSRPAPSQTLSRLVRGATDFLTPRQDAHARLEALKLERKQILALRMNNVGVFDAS